MDHVLVSGEAAQLAKHEDMFKQISLHTRDITVYTSDSRDLAVGKIVSGTELGQAPSSVSLDADSISLPSVPAIEVEGFGIGL